MNGAPEDQAPNQPPARTSAAGAGRAAQGGQGVGGTPAAPGREAEEAAANSRTQSSPGPDRNLTPSGPGEDPADSSKVEHDLAALLADTEAKKDEYLELAQRTKADFENYRKRMAAEVQAAQVRGKVEVAREVIEAVDNLERALAAAEAGGDLATGVEMVLTGLRETLARNNVEAVEPQGERFDPQWHEALSTAPAEGVESGHVVEVVQKGYRLGEQLVRPARVVVSE
ncbi:MAG TPA: nucleotide exchange factor GrpE [Solirubrobacterales bacterium]|nr:nucleotide exchange factor GrpE [Solirubrobacterales bacterium]